MEILASCSYEESTAYDGKLLVGDSDKPDKLSLNIVSNDGNTSILSKLPLSVRCVTYIGDVNFEGISIPKNKVFVEYTQETLPEVINLPEDVVPLLRVDNSFSDMRVLKKLCEKHSSLRIIGGNLLNIEGVRIGRYSNGKDKGSPLYNGIYDTFLEVNLSDLNNIKNIVKKVKRRSDPESSVKSAKNAKSKKAVTKKSDIAKSFSSLFSGGEEDF